MLHISLNLFCDNFLKVRYKITLIVVTLTLIQNKFRYLQFMF